ncbi:MAG: hypothetical protein WBV82_22595 [Myxococcaceae bacterium]
MSDSYPLVALAVLASLPAMGATAERASIRLEYRAEAKESCPSESELQALVAARLGFDPFDPDARLLTTVAIVKRNSRLQGTVELRDEDDKLVGAREVEAPVGQCSALADSLALTLAIAIDPQLLTRVASPPAAEPAPPTPPAPAPPAPEPVPTPAPPMPQHRPSTPKWPVHLEASAGAAVAAGLLPQTAFGVFLQAGVRSGRFLASVEGTFFSESVLSAAGGRVHASALRGSIRACGLAGPFGFCVRGSGGVLRALGDGFKLDRRGILPTATVGPLVFAERKLFSGVFGRVAVGLDVPLLRSSVYVGNQEIWQAPPVAFDAGVSLGWEFR